jgi:hypothetical protein
VVATAAQGGPELVQALIQPHWSEKRKGEKKISIGLLLAGGVMRPRESLMFQPGPMSPCRPSVCRLGGDMPRCSSTSWCQLSFSPNQLIAPSRAFSPDMHRRMSSHRRKPQHRKVTGLPCALACCPFSSVATTLHHLSHAQYVER